MHSATRILCCKARYDKEWYHQLYSLTTEEEKQHLDRYRLFHQRYDSLLGLVIAKVLAYGKADASISLRHKNSGQPFFEGDSRFLSISHSAGFVLAAVSPYPIGVDIEETLKPEEADAELFLSPDERAELHSNCMEQDLTILWTLKEAYAKCTQKGYLQNPVEWSFTRIDGKWTMPGYTAGTFSDLLPGAVISVVSQSPVIPVIQVSSEEKIAETVKPCRSS